VFNACENVPKFYPHAYEFLYTLYYTGCRPIEVLEINRWSVLDATHFQLATAKGNYPRTIEKSAVYSTFAAAIEDGYVTYWLASIRQFRYAFNSIYEYAGATIGDKEVELYLYRHRMFKLLYEESYTIPQITDIMGEHSDTITEGYVFSNIYVPD
jgi:integrase